MDYFEMIKLYVADLAAVRDFYGDRLGVEVLAMSGGQLHLGCGRTRLVFEEREGATPYHYAINIPSRQEEQALAWLQERVDILPFGEQEIVDFSNWNAKAIYFYDPAGNIGELIARRNLDDPDVRPFSAAAFREVSEIGLGTSAIEPLYRRLHETTGMGIFDGSFDRFCAIGEERALFITVDYQQKKWFPVDDDVHPSAFEALLRRNDELFQIIYREEYLEVEMH